MAQLAPGQHLHLWVGIWHGNSVATWDAHILVPAWAPWKAVGYGSSGWDPAAHVENQAVPGSRLRLVPAAAGPGCGWSRLRQAFWQSVTHLSCGSVIHRVPPLCFGFPVCSIIPPSPQYSSKQLFLHQCIYSEGSCIRR